MTILLLENVIASQLKPRPILKWAGGKSQLLMELIKRIPKNYNNYIEPFVGGGALFFALLPKSGILSDSNPELINVYKCVSENVQEVIRYLRGFKNTEEEFYHYRSKHYEEMDEFYAAARTIFLNRTCYNGLYRVNQKGYFNVPYGHYKSPNICQEEVLKAASQALKGITIECGDYKSILNKYAKAGDFVFLDPPYLPVSKYADFKRYTKEQFYEEDHKELAETVHNLHQTGCHIILTNSNHPLVHEFYRSYKIDIINTKRNINSKGTSRTGEDVIVSIPPKIPEFSLILSSPLPAQVKKYPPTRFMGSKEKILQQIHDVAQKFKYHTVLDLFSGSGVVGYMFKALGKEVITNDYMAMCSEYSKAMIENSHVTLSDDEIEQLVKSTNNRDRFVENNYKDLYFTKEENIFIDTIRANIHNLNKPYKCSIAITALIRACIKKRPRGVFTYTGHRYDDGRADLQLSLKEHFIKAVKLINNAVFNNGQQCKARCGDAMTIKCRPDLVYIDPPYFSPLSDNEYVRRYHFVEGLARDWAGVDMQWHTKTKKFKSYPTPFSSRSGAADAFDRLFQKFSSSILIVSYSSNSLPTKEEMLSILSCHKKHVEVIEINYRYSFANQNHKIGSNNNKVHEYLFIGY